MHSSQDAPSGTWVLRSLVVLVGMAGLLAGCQEPQAAAAGQGEVTQTGMRSGQACGDSTAAADRVLFEYDSAELRPDARAILDALATKMQQQPQCGFVIEGYCDERGTREYNLALGEKRATSVRSYLAALGVDPARMQTISYGKDRPAVTGSNEEAWAKNRRAVMVFQSP